MSRLVVDASVAIKWFLDEEYSGIAREVLNGEHTLMAPDLLYPEFGNVLWKRVGKGEMTAEESRAVAKALLQIPVHVHSSRGLLEPALEIANRTQRTVYDSTYLALAVRERSILVTADKRLFNAVQATPVSRYLMWIENAA